MTTNQTIIIEELWLAGKKENVREISKNTGLTEKQVYEGLRGLKNRRLVPKPEKKGRNIYVEFNQDVIPRIKTILKKEEEDGN